MLRDLTFCCAICIFFASNQIKEESNNKKSLCFFLVTLNNFRYKRQLLTFFEQLLSNFLRNYGKLFGNFEQLVEALTYSYPKAKNMK